jgi:NADPH:quinone reductase-like Zn-dependent oxidoreductase
VGDLVFGHGVARVMAGFLRLPKPSLTTGTLAEYAVFEADTPFIARRPENLDVAMAAALPTAGLTTRAITARVAPQPGDRVLLIGATGGVGTTLLPELAGHVIATGYPDDAALLRELGAAEVIDYGHYPAGVDVVVNTVLPGDQLQAAFDSLHPGGRLYTITFPAPADDRGELVLDTSVAMRETIGLRPTIGRRYPLDEAARAMVDFARAHTVGKLVVVA